MKRSEEIFSKRGPKSEGDFEKDDCLSLQSQCDLLGISKSGLYYVPKGESEENLEIMKKMDKHHYDHPTYGVLQMQEYLFTLSYPVNPKRVRRLMRKARITAQYPKRNLTAIIDVYSRFIVGWGLHK
ncbi:MAG: IS3 family transposase [Proteiniphilum sp.]|nr:IS3 family transposase [Proteiniphilum sp.]